MGYMKRELIFCLGLSIICLFSISIIFAEKSISYDFDKIEVAYAAQFTIKPVNVEADSWLVEVAGGKDQSIEVLYGVINLKKDGEIFITEEFIKVGGEGSSERFLMNSGSFNYYDGTGDYESIITTFWSGKKLTENQLIKDYSQSMNALVLTRNFDKDQNLIGIELNGQYSQGNSSEEEIKTLIGKNSYEGDIATIKQEGNSKSFGSA